MDELIAQIVNALQTRTTLPKFPNSLTVTEAYEIQHHVVSNLGSDSVVGIKAGLTSKGSQEAFGISDPVLGRIFEFGRLFSGTSFKETTGGFLECEIGVCLDESGSPISVCPVIELPRLAFRDSEDALGPNLVACNVAADRYIVGDCTEIPTSFAERTVTLSRDREILCTASLSEPLGGPLDSLAWMLTEVKARDIAVPDGALMLTGACGGIHPARPGKCVADYGSLGRVEFEVLVD